MKAMTTKQAEKWLERLKSSNPNAFKEINKALKKYERTNDEHECFIRLNTILLDHTDLTAELNVFLDEGHKFVINRSQVERINDLVKYIKKVDPKAFNEIVKMITSLSNQRSAGEGSEPNEDEQNHHLINFVLEQVKENTELAAYANKALYYSAQQLIQTLDLSHLKTVKKSDAHSKPEESYELPRQPAPEREDRIEPDKPIRKYYPPFLNSNDEKVFLKQLESTLDPYLYNELMKILEIYQLGILSKDETLQLLKNNFNDTDYVALKDMVETRETDRRRNCPFKPLSEFDYSKYERATHSYVTMPPIYPHFCSGKNPVLDEVLNKEWVSVPRGSEDTFNIRVKNTHEENLIKAEDDRYEFDIFFYRLKKSLTLLDKISTALEENADAKLDKEMKLVLNLGVIQTLYKNCSKEQREEMEFHLSKNQLPTIQLFRQRLKNMMTELQEIRNVHGLKTWNQVSQKNFFKSLDIKGHEFKRIEKIKIKNGVFLEELKKRVSFLENEDRSEDEQDNMFSDEKKSFFDVFNSFEPTSRSERCVSRKLPVPQSFEIKKGRNNTLLPAIILAFEDESALAFAYSLISFSLDSSSVTEQEKVRCKMTARMVLSSFLKLERFESRSLSTAFDQDIFFSIINKTSDMVDENLKLEDWIHEEADENIPIDEKAEELPTFNVMQGESEEYDYLPAKDEDTLVFYASESFYVFMRLLYTLFERIIRMREILADKEKILLFEILYYTCIKCKESSRSEEALNSLFGPKQAYIFTTFYKVVENLCKSLNAVSLCNITTYSLKIMKSKSEAAYIQLLNNYLLSNDVTSTKLIRCAFGLSTRLLYINSLDSRYSTKQQVKELQKRRAEITQKIEIYTLMGSEFEPQEKEGATQVGIKNRLEYCFEGNSIKLTTLAGKEDLQILNSRPKASATRTQDLKKAIRFLERLR